MNKIKEIWSIYWILVFFILITIVGFYGLYFLGKDSLIFKIYTALDTASAVALAVLAFVAYWQYTKTLNERKIYKKSLRKKGNKKNELALIIQFGGTGELLPIMESFVIEELKLSQNSILKKSDFGDSSHNVDSSDIRDLKNYCTKVKSELSLASQVHILYAGLGVGYAVVGDILNNSTDLLFYHKDGESYKVWYADTKSEKREENINETQI